MHYTLIFVLHIINLFFNIKCIYYFTNNNSFLRNMVVRVTGKYISLIYIIRIDSELIERVGYMISCVHVDIFY